MVSRSFWCLLERGITVTLLVLAELSGEVLRVLHIGVMLPMIHPLLNDLLGCDARSQNGVPVEDVRSES